MLTNFISKLHFVDAAQWENVCLLACVRPWVPNIGNREDKRGRKGKEGGRGGIVISKGL